MIEIILDFFVLSFTILPILIGLFSLFKSNTEDSHDILEENVEEQSINSLGTPPTPHVSPYYLSSRISSACVPELHSFYRCSYCSTLFSSLPDNCDNCGSGDIEIFSINEKK